MSVTRVKVATVCAAPGLRCNRCDSCLMLTQTNDGGRGSFCFFAYPDIPPFPILPSPNICQMPSAVEQMLQILSSITKDPAGMRWRRKSSRKQITTQTFWLFTVYFSTIMIMRENGSLWMLLVMMFCTLSICSITLASKLESLPLMLFDSNGHSSELRSVSSNHLRSNHTC